MDATTPTPTPALTAHLTSLIPQDDTTHTALLTTLLPSLLGSLHTIASTLQHSHSVRATNTSNTFGDAQLNVDVAAESILRATLAANASVATASSEEDPVERQTQQQQQTQNEDDAQQQCCYTVAFDPLDGSSIIAPNWTVGTIIGIWDGATALQQHADSRQVAAVLGVYGPRTTAIVAVRISGTTNGGSCSCFEVSILPDKIDLLRSNVSLAATTATTTTRYFAPANLRAAAEDARYMQLVTRWIGEGCTLRYCGGLVPDVVHALVKGQGVYVSPVTGRSRAKLRKLYEVFPVALVVECAGGKAVDPVSGKRVLDGVIGATEERAGLICGTAEEVEMAAAVLLG